jgi:hypothetical protein
LIGLFLVPAVISVINVTFDHITCPRSGIPVNNMLHRIYPSIRLKLSIYLLPLARFSAVYLPHSNSLQIRITLPSGAYNSILKQLYSQVINDNLMAQTVISMSLLFYTLKFTNCTSGQTFQLLNKAVVLPLATLDVKVLCPIEF